MASENTKAAETAVKQEEFVKKLEDDDEFEDFPEDDWEEIQEISASTETKLWEESWEDHDDYKDDFTKKLRDELNKSAAN